MGDVMQKPISNKLWYPFVVIMTGLMILMFIGMSQPVWRGEEMAAEFKERCARRGGIFTERKVKWLGGTSYECAPYIGKKEVYSVDYACPTFESIEDGSCAKDPNNIIKDN